MKKERFYSVDILRFIGAIIIVFFHTVTGIQFFYKSDLPSIVNICNNAHWGFVWVDFFFILSGFFLFYKTNFEISTPKFALKKIIRLLPVLIFVLLLYKLLSILGLLYWQKYINIYSMLLLSNVGLTAQNTMGNIHSSWFVSSLFWGYMFYFYLRKLVNEKWFNFITSILVFFSYVYLTNTTYHPPLVNQNFVCAGMLRVFGGLGLGYFVYMLLKNIKFECKNLIQKLLFTFAEGYLLIFCLNNTLFHKCSFDNISIMILAFTALIVLFLMQEGFVSQIFNNKLSTILGRYSYSIIISHLIIFDLMKMNIWDKNLMLLSNNLFYNIALTTVGGIVLGIFTYHFVEVPLTAYLLGKFSLKQHSDLTREN